MGILLAPRTGLGFLSLLACLCLLSVPAITPVPLASAAPGAVEEEIAIAAGERVVRSVTSGAMPASALPPASAPPPAAAPGGRAVGVLWVDTNHLAGIAQNVAMSGDGATVVGGWWLNSARVALYATGGAGVPAWNFPITTSFFVPVDASNDAAVVTGTGRQDLLYAWNAASSTPVCAKPHPAGEEGNLAITPDVGGQFAGSSTPASGNSTTQNFTLGCARLFASPLVGQVQGGRAAADGAWVAINSRTVVHVYDSQTGVLRGSAPIPGETQATVGISRDGSVLAIGGFVSTLFVYRWNGSQYALAWSTVVPVSTWITAVDVSDNGSTVMVGTWVFTTPDLGRVIMYDVAAGPTPLWVNSEFGDYVASVALSADGSRGVAGSWGRLNGTFGHAIAVFDRTSSVPILAVEDDQLAGVGSVMAVDISNDGRLACAGGKAVHARDFGNGGFALALDLPAAAAVASGTGAAARPVRLELGPGRPNPLRLATAVPFVLAEGAPVRLSIFDGAGRAVRVLDLGLRQPGAGEAQWDGRDAAGHRVPSGNYFCRLEAGAASATRPLVVVR